MANSKREVVAEAQTVPAASYNVFHNKGGWLVPGLLIIIILLLISMFAHGWDHGNGRFDTRDFRGMGMMRQERGLRSSGGIGANTNQDRIRGVVTAVNGSTFTIAGGGATNEVTTNGSTQYQGGSQPKVNDSVVAFGTTNGGTFTAAQVIINP